MRYRGVKVRVGYEKDQFVDGWLYAETPLGKYISLDRNGKFIRFFPAGETFTISYDHDGEKAAFFNEKIQNDISSQNAEELKYSMSKALDRLDYNQIRRISVRIRNNESRLKATDETPFLDDEFIIEIALEAWSAHNELLEEVIKSQVGAVLLEHRDLIRSIISKDAIPEFDAAVSTPSEIDEMIKLAKEKDYLDKFYLGKNLLINIAPDKLYQLIIEFSKEKIVKSEEIRAIRLKKIAALSKLTVGGLFTAVNLTLGGFTGVLTALPTLGLGTVAAVIGIATSSYTGLNSACDALKDFASTIEKR